MLTPEVAYEIGEPAVDPMRAVVWCPASVSEPTPSFLFVSREPLVADATTDAVSSAQLRHRKAITKRIINKSNPLFHRCSLQPRHRPSSQDKA